MEELNELDNGGKWTDNVLGQDLFMQSKEWSRSETLSVNIATELLPEPWIPPEAYFINSRFQHLQSFVWLFSLYFLQYLHYWPKI